MEALLLNVERGFIARASAKALAQADVRDHFFTVITAHTVTQVNVQVRTVRFKPQAEYGLRSSNLQTSLLVDCHIGRR
ncbi:hypothetical protein H8A99_33430 [Bradyrhizobium sp. Arg68]|uniref:hypothetical protein n=1 Tax=Bradyrhizobium ivorense TaxID=2511166 RepID=UPI001E4B9F0F|nr:hypothetical protein [Bradyrhizobium ivorense]MCC8941203.1 hypothetical protein [Bradyrhizobium ivorense]